MTARTGASVYLDDIAVTGGSRTYVMNNTDVGNNTSYDVTGLSQNTTYYYVVRAYNAYGTSANSNEISATTTSTSPVITVTGTLTAFSTVAGSASAAQSYTVAGSNLTADISVTAPAGFELSKTEAGTYSGSLVYSPTGGSVATQDVFVRIAASATAGSVSGNISHTSTGATQVDKAVSGTVYKAEPSNHVVGFTAVPGSVPYSELSLSWTDAAKVTPDGYLIKGSDVGYGSITAPVDGTPEADGALVKNVNQGVGTAVLTGLSPNTTYYFMIFPYTNSEAQISFKTDGSVPQTSGITSTAPSIVHYWNFNSNLPTGNWEQPIAAAQGSGSLTYSFANAITFTGTTVNGVSGETNGGSFVPQGGTDLANNGLEYILSAPTTGYEDVSLSYATQRTSQGFTSQAIYYTIDGTNYTLKETILDIPASFATRTVDLSGDFGVTDNPNFKIKVVLDGASSSSGNNRFDNIRLSGQAIEVIVNADGTATGATIVTGGDVPESLLGPDSGVPAVIYTITASGVRDVTVNRPAAFGNIDWYCWLNTPGGLLAAGNPIAAGNASYVFTNVNFDAKGDVVVIMNDNSTLPVELSSFTATLDAHNYVQLTWVTQTETGVQGYYIYRAGINDLGTAQLVSTMIPATNTSQQQTYIFVDSELFEDGMYYYWLQNADFDGSSSFHGPVAIQFTTGGGNNGTPNIPLSTQLKAAFPNPFNPSTRIPYDLAKSAEVKISIYNSRGQLVRIFPIGSKDAGSHHIEWNGKSDRNEDCATGVYYIRMQADGKLYNSKAVLMK